MPTSVPTAQAALDGHVAQIIAASTSVMMPSTSSHPVALAGRSRAEQGRLLIFLMPLALVAIYFWAGRTMPGRRLIALLFCSQMAACLVIGARWMVP